jgi:hypothetical protein
LPATEGLIALHSCHGVEKIFLEYQEVIVQGDVMFNRRSVLAAAIGAVVCFSSPVVFAQVPAQEVWTGFEVGAVGSSWTVPFETTPITFSGVLSAPAYLKIVDLGLAGDRFEVFINGVSAGNTSAPTLAIGVNDPSYFFGDEALALADSNFSRGEFLLPQGTITVSVMASMSPLDASIAAFQVSAIPEPASLAMLLAGAGVVGLARRRQARAA